MGFEMAFESLQGMTSLMSAGSREFQVCGAATENARRASSVRTVGTVTVSSAWGYSTSDDHRQRSSRLGMQLSGAGRSGMLLLKMTSP